MNLRLRMVILFLFATVASGLGDERIQRWRDERLKHLAALGTTPTHQDFMSAAGALGIGEMGSHMTPEHREVFEQAMAAILSLPGHTEYFESEIEAAIEGEFREAAGKGGVYPSRPRCFVLLGYLKSSQVVALLGELLEDDRDPWKIVPPGEISQGRPPPNSYLAAKTLNRIGIEGVPIIEIRNGDRDYELARDQWKLWYAAVKAGNRTFRFTGDPREYTLEGPVETAVSAKALPSVRTAVTSAGHEDATAARERGMPWVALASAIAVLGLAVRAAWKARRKG